MSTIPRNVLVLASVWLAFEGVAASTFQGIGFLPGKTDSDGFSVSADGRVVAGTSGYASGSPHAFRWTETDGMSDLGVLAAPGVSGSLGIGVSPDGSVIAGRTEGTRIAFQWTEGAGIQGLGMFPGGNSSQANNTSFDGTVIVGNGNHGGPATEAFRWTAGTGLVGLGYLPGGASSHAGNVSSDGSTVSGQSDSFTGSQAFRWTAAAGMTGLGFLPGGHSSLAGGLSVDGTVVIGESDSSDGSQAFRWTETEGMVGLGFLPGALSSRVGGVTGDGSVVVGDNVMDVPLSPLDFQAFVWTESDGMRALQDVLVADFALGSSLAGWWLGGARDISDDGTTIVGIGLNPFGQTEGWIAHLDVPLSASVPEGSGVVAGLSLLALVALRKSGRSGIAALAAALGLWRRCDPSEPS